MASLPFAVIGRVFGNFITSFRIDFINSRSLSPLNGNYPYIIA